MVKRVTKIASSVITAILTVMLLFNMGVRVGFARFYLAANVHSRIEGLADGLVPQGLDIIDGKVVISGYNSKGKPSRVYVQDGNRFSYTDLLTENGESCYAEAGGIAHGGDYVYISDSGYLNVYSLEDIISGEAKSKRLGRIDTLGVSAWCMAYGGYVYVGSYADPATDYKPVEKEVITTPSSDENVSIILAFKLDDSYELGVNPTPEFAFSSGTRVQGGCFFSEDRLILSTSHGLKPSQLKFYTIDKEYKGEYTLLIDSNEHTIPIYYLDSSNEKTSIRTYPMLGGIAINDGNLLVLNESASNKYFFGKLVIGGNKIFELKLKDKYFK